METEYDEFEDLDSLDDGEFVPEENEVWVSPDDWNEVEDVDDWAFVEDREDV